MTLLFIFDAFGTAREVGRGWPLSTSATSPCGLSTVAKNNPSCLACLLAVIAFPPRAMRSVTSGFRRSCGTMRPSDCSRPFVILFFRSRQLPHNAEAESSPWVRTQNFVPTPSPIHTSDQRISGFVAKRRLTHGRAPYGASLSFGLALHHRLPPDASSRTTTTTTSPAPLSLRCQVPSVRVLRGLSPPVLCPCQAHVGLSRRERREQRRQQTGEARTEEAS